MRNRHWSDGDFLARLYSVGPQEGHLQECHDCLQRWEHFRARREQLRVSAAGVSEEFLSAQRRAVLSRLQPRRRTFHFELLPALTAVLLFCVLITVFRETPQTPPVQPAAEIQLAGDSQLFEELFSIASSSEPLAVEPLRSLFEVQQ